MSATTSNHAALPFVLLLTCVAALCPTAPAQSRSTAARPLQLSTFGMLGGTFTGLGGSGAGWGGRNLSLTAGADLGFYNFGHYGLAAEARGTYPLVQGRVDGQLSVLGGLRVERRFESGSVAAFVPYLDVLAGRGEMRYVNGGYVTPGITYTRTTGNVGSLGGGFEIALTQRLAIKADAQFQRWSTPVTADHHVNAKQASVGMLYRFGIRRHPD